MNRIKPYRRTIVASAILILAVFATQYLSRAENIPAGKPFSEFPLQLDVWKGKKERFEQRIYDILGVDDSILANYVDEGRRYVQLYIGYYESQREGDLIHSPRNCMPGAGWNVADISYEMVKNNQAANNLSKVIKLTLVKGKQKQIVLYWFHSRGRIIHSEYWQKIYLVIDSILRNRTDGSFVRLISPVIDGNEQAAVKNLKDFAEALMPVLYEFIPS